MRQDAEARAQMYGLLSAVFLHPPTGDLLRQITDREFLADLSAFFSREAISELEAFAAGASVEADLGSLRQEYMDLFAVPTGRYVSPFEDVYRGESMDGQPARGPLLGERAIAVRRLYREAGAEMGPECKELPTHIGVELSFMSFLCEREREAVSHDEHCLATGDGAAARCRALQRTFLLGHLNAWFPQLCKAIHAKAKSRLYRALASITEEFLARDAVELLLRAPADEGRPSGAAAGIAV